MKNNIKKFIRNKIKENRMNLLVIPVSITFVLYFIDKIFEIDLMIKKSIILILIFSMLLISFWEIFRKHDEEGEYE